MKKVKLHYKSMLITEDVYDELKRVRYELSTPERQATFTEAIKVLVDNYEKEINK